MKLTQQLLKFAMIILFLHACKKDVTDLVPNTSIPTSNIILSTEPNESGSVLHVMDTTGKPIISKNIPTNIWNFQKWELNGNVRFTYAELNPAEKTGAIQGTSPTWQVLLDRNLNEIKRWSIISHDGKNYSTPSAYDLHDFILLSDDHFIGISYQQMTVNNIPASLNPVPNCKVLSPVIQEVQNGKVIWEWVGADYPEFYTTSIEGNAFNDSSKVNDYMHLNSIYIDPNDHNLICSFRNLNQVVKLDRSSGNILWRLGGVNSDFAISSDMKFLRQHHATITDDGRNLLLVDNGQITERPYSRILEFGLNELSKSINFYREVDLPDSTFIQFTGSVQKIGNTYFIGCGTANKFMQINYETKQVLINHPLTYSSYRVLRY